MSSSVQQRSLRPACPGIRWGHALLRIVAVLLLTGLLWGILTVTVRAGSIVVSAQQSPTTDAHDALPEQLLPDLLQREYHEAAPTPPLYWMPPDPAYRISIGTDGVHQLNYTYLQSAGLPIDTLDPRTIRIFYGGQEMAIEVDGEGDGRFDPSDAVRFYARSVDSLYVEGHLPDHKYTATNIYWLSYGGSPGRRMVLKDQQQAGTAVVSYRATLHLEQQKRYETRYPRYSSGPRFSPMDDRWFWFKLQMIGIPGTKSQLFTLPVSHRATGTYTATIKAHLVGALDNRHGVRLKLNDQLIFEDRDTWRSYAPFTAVAEFDQSRLINGDNRLLVEVFNIDENISEVYIDWIEIGYAREHVAFSNQLTFAGQDSPGPWHYSLSNFTQSAIQVYDITDHHNVQRLANVQQTGTGPYSAHFGDAMMNRHYHALTAAAQQVPASISLVTYLSATYAPDSPLLATENADRLDLLDPNNGADWIAIAPRDFWTATLPLAIHRAAEMRVALVDVQQIYDQFNGGLMSAEAMRDFLAYTYDHWQPPAPQYVLLVGGGTSDMRPYFTNSKPTYMPAYLYPADPILGDTAADNRFVTLIGDDILPDMHIGRIPAFSAEEVTIVVSKTISYESTPPLNEWNTNVLLISDDLEGGGGDFYAFSDTLANGSADSADPTATKFLPEPYKATKVYLGRTCDTNNPKVANECRTDIADAINQGGALLVSYVGHAQTKNWAIERLMDQTLASSLTNRDKLSIFLGMACFEGFFHEPPLGSRSLAETYLFNPEGGAVASWSPTGFGVATGHDWLEQGLFLSLFQQHEKRLGAAMTYGKLYLHEKAPAHKYDDLIDTFNLLGDPALKVQTYIVPTAIEMMDFSARWQDSQVVIEWTTGNEASLFAFYVLRSDRVDGDYVRVHLEPVLTDSAGTISGADYQLIDTPPSDMKTPWYQLEILKRDGSSHRYGLVQARPLTNTNELFLPIVTRSAE